MFIYFVDRYIDTSGEMNILGQANSDLPSGIKIIDDKTVQDLETGIRSFSCTLPYSSDYLAKAEEYTTPGNYIIMHEDDEDRCYTIIESEEDTEAQEILIYAEDIGLDLLNSTVPKYPDPEMGDDETLSASIDWYIDKWITGTGFEIGYCYTDTSIKKKLKLDESTLSKRLLDIADAFSTHISFRFNIQGMELKNRYIDIKENTENERKNNLYKGKHWQKLVVKKNITNVATALQVVGKEENGFLTTLDGLSYDDGDIYIADRTDYPSTASHKALLYSRTAKQKWGRTYTSGGDIIKVFKFETTDQNRLLQESIKELKEVSKMETTYDVEILSLPDKITVGEYVYLIDQEAKYYIKARLTKLETSEYNSSISAEFDNYSLVRFN